MPIAKACPVSSRALVGSRRRPTLRRRTHPGGARHLFAAILSGLFLAVLPGSPGLDAQERPEAALRVATLEATPGSLSMTAGETARVEVTALDGEGEVVEDAPVALVGPRQALSVANGEVTALVAGEYALTAWVVLPPGADREPVSLRIPVTVEWPAVSRLEVRTDEGRLYEGVTLRHRVRALHADGSERPDPEPEWSVSEPSVAEVDDHGNVTAVGTGTVTVTAEVDGVLGSVEHRVEAFPGARLEIQGARSPLRTGDVLLLEADLVDDEGRSVEGVPVTWSYVWDPGHRDLRHPGAAAEVRAGEFVAEVPGEYQVIALAGPLSARTSFRVDERDVVQPIDLVGHGRVNEYNTSDFWVFEGNDGRDYALTGTWGADGWAYMWDVTDPTNPVRTDSIKVDARTVNDVKVSPDARYATMTREGASDRVNGLVILDLEDPAHPVVAAEFDEGLTGGVHNAWPSEDYVYALSAGRNYRIIDVTDIYAPRYVSTVEHEDCRIHDVWVEEGLAYAAQWGCGVVVHDVGHGGWGGSPESPVFVSQYVTPGGRTHDIFPYRQEETGRFYVFLGDEIIGRPGQAWGGVTYSPEDISARSGDLPGQTDGYIHIVDFTDPENPKKVARYHVPEYGTHNTWVADDILYQAYYEGGMRVVDVSGELRGNLAEQGREIAVFKPYDPDGFTPNAPMVWSVMPYKGRIFLSDMNSGLWTVELEPRDPPVS